MSVFRLPVPEDELFRPALRAARGDYTLAEEAIQHLRVQFWRGLYNPTRPFDPWAVTVIRRYCLDAFRLCLRASERAGGRGAGGADAAFPDVIAARYDLPVLEAGFDLNAPFCTADRAAVLAWRPKQRFVALGWHGLWGKLTPGDSADTLAAVKPVEPFPVPGFLTWLNKDRTRYLARALECPENSVAKICLSHRNRLARLRFIRELRGG